MWRNVRRNLELYILLAYLVCLFGYSFYGWNMFWVEAYSQVAK